MPREDKEGRRGPYLSFSELKASLVQFGVTTLTLLQPDTTPDPSWTVVPVPGYEDNGLKFRIEFAAGTTPEKITSAKSAIASAKLRARERDKVLAEIVADMEELSEANLERIERAMKGDWLMRNKRIIDHLKLPIDLDIWEIL